MDIDYFKYFLKVAELKSTTKAAVCFNLSQSAMSRAISQLEFEMRTPLFDRIGKNLILNEYGKILVTYFDDFLNALEDGMKKVKYISKVPSGIIRIATFALSESIIDCISAYSKANPNVSFVLRSNINQYPHYSMQDLDVVFFSDFFKIENMDKVSLFSEQYAVLMSQDHALANERGIDLAELKDKRFIFSEDDDSNLHDYSYDFCLESGFSPAKKCITSNVFIKSELISNGTAISLMPVSSFKSDQNVENTVKTVPLLKPQKSRTVYIGWGTGKYMTEATKSFIAFTISYFMQTTGSAISQQKPRF